MQNTHFTQTNYLKIIEKETVLMSIKIYKYLIMAICILFMSVISGCGESAPDSEQIKTDLSNTDLVIVNDLYNNNGLIDENGHTENHKMVITDVIINDVHREGDDYEVLCEIFQSDSNYKEKIILTVFYTKSDNWEFKSYHKTDGEEIHPISGVPDEYIYDIRPQAKQYSAGTTPNGDNIYWGGSIGYEKESVEHNFDRESGKDTIKTECVLYGAACDSTIQIKAEFEFNKQWTLNSLNYKTTSRNWHINTLCDKIFKTDNSNSISRIFKINSVDEKNKTIDISYGEQSLTYSETCKYEVKSQISDNRDEEVIFINLSNDKYNVELHENDIVYGTSIISMVSVK